MTEVTYLIPLVLLIIGLVTIVFAPYFILNTKTQNNPHQSTQITLSLLIGALLVVMSWLITLIILYKQVHP